MEKSGTFLNFSLSLFINFLTRNFNKFHQHFSPSFHSVFPTHQFTNQHQLKQSINHAFSLGFHQYFMIKKVTSAIDLSIFSSAETSLLSIDSNIERKKQKKNLERWRLEENEKLVGNDFVNNGK